MESNAVLQLKAQNAKLKAELKAIRYEKHGRLQEALERKNLALTALHMVWCDGGCNGGVRGGEVTAEMVAYAENYVKRLRTWFINHAGKEISRRSQPGGRPGSTEWKDWMALHDVAWENARRDIDEAATKAGYNILEDEENGRN